jgi:hypothetical protein
MHTSLTTFAQGLARTARTTGLAALMLAPLAFGATEAQASAIQVRDGNGGNVFNGGPGHVNLSIRVNGVGQSVAAGAFVLEYRQGANGTWTSFMTYCLEPDEWLGISATTPKHGTLAGDLTGTAEYATSGHALSALYTTWFDDSLTSATKSAAFQVAVWEIAFDTGRNLAAGVFQLNGNNNSVRDQATAYLNQANWDAPEQVGVILRVGNQDLIIQVPEPGAVALFSVALLGLGLGLAARRRLAAAQARG